jgi:hypothetical protein
LGFCPLSRATPPTGEKKGRVEEEEGERRKTVRRVTAGASLQRFDGDARSRTREALCVTAVGAEYGPDTNQ